MSAVPDRYVVIGNPVAHSKSPDIHTLFAAQTGQNLTYDRLPVPLGGFSDAVQDLMRQHVKGANVTVPFKLDAYAAAGVLTERAQAAGAVNTLKFENGAIIGDNTDGIGLVTDIVRNAGVPMNGKKILLLGAGGAARGVILPILNQQPAQLVIANRTVSKAMDLARQFGEYGVVDASSFESLHEPFDIIINATSASLSADLPPIPAAIFGAGAFAYDMMYAKDPTVFMRFALQHGAIVRDGLGMLVEQAAESFFVWRGTRPDTAPVFSMLRANL